MATVDLNETITIAISVSDRHASANWFATHLGFELVFHGDEIGWSELSTKTPGVVLGLGEQTEPRPGNAIPVFGVGDLDAARAALEDQGIVFDGATETIPGMVKLATFYDPDHNAFMLAQDLSDTP